ncbi:hypothetical protein HELRODRAFT_85254, partial [Helobdella robusta]|uniref:C2 domain-containing protein n=1 Tax=Helobdella robusta TaxID=6412 RepID=T1G5U7_HELRO
QQATKRRTKTKIKTRNPEFDETVEYHGVEEEDLQRKMLRITVFDETRLSSKFIGETMIMLKSLVTDRTKDYSVYLSGLQEMRKVSDHDRGRILVGMMYNSSRNQLHIAIKRCANLVAMDSNGFSDPFVKLYLRPDKDKKSKFKTKVQSKTLNPEFNEEFVYSVKTNELINKTLDVSVWDKDFARNEYIGMLLQFLLLLLVVLFHWMEVINNNNQFFERWHVLKNIHHH